MPDPELTAYLDGEADPETVQAFDARLRSDPTLRAEALLLLRQRVLLSRVLAAATQPQVKPQPVTGRTTKTAKTTKTARTPLRNPHTGRIRRRRPQGSRRWWLIAAPFLAAAGLTAALILSRQDQPELQPAHPIADQPSPTPPQQQTTNVRLADGSSWQPGQRIVAEPGRPTVYQLADGSSLTLEAGSTLLVPAPGSAWTLETGSVICKPAPGSTAFTAGFHTDQVEIMILDGSCQLYSNTHGTVVKALDGRTTIRDLLTGFFTRLDDDRPCWIPADSAGPVAEKAAHGSLRGVITKVGRDHRVIVLATRFGGFELATPWRGSEAKTTEQSTLKGLESGLSVMVEWNFDERLRVLSYRRIELPIKHPYIPDPNQSKKPEAPEPAPPDNF